MLVPAIQKSAEYIESIILDMCKHQIPMSNIAINIGASDGVTLDMLYKLYIDQSYGGLCIEGHHPNMSALRSNIPDKVDKLCTYVTPNNILPLIEKYSDIDIISIDIDSYDYLILEKVITKYPKVIVIELNENIPPGITYYAKYGENYDYGIHDRYQLFGCSLDAVTQLGNQYGYKLLKMEWNNAVLIQSQYTNLFDIPSSNKEAYSQGYYNREHRQAVFFWKGEESKCFDMSLNEAFAYLQQFFAKDLDKIVLEYTI
jgi:hypothetical protein